MNIIYLFKKVWEELLVSLFGLLKKKKNHTNLVFRKLRINSKYQGGSNNMIFVFYNFFAFIRSNLHISTYNYIRTYKFLHTLGMLSTHSIFKFFLRINMPAAVLYFCFDFG